MGVFNNTFGNTFNVQLGANVNLPDYVKAFLPANIPTVNIYGQDWQLRNLEIITTPLNTLLTNVTNDAAWASLSTEGWRYFDNNINNGAIYGKHYNWWAQKKIDDDIKAYNILNPSHPILFKLATHADYYALTKNLGGLSVSAGKMKEAGITHWATPNTGADNSSGFTMLGAGFVTPAGASSQLMGYAFMWANTEFSADNAVEINGNNASAALGLANLDKNYGFTVRMIKRNLYTIYGNVGIIGDSTIDNMTKDGVYYEAVSDSFIVTGTLSDISLPGDTILMQQTKWNALNAGVKSAMNYVFIQIGLNDIITGTAESTATLLGRYQTLIDTINTYAPNAVIVGGTLTPCKAYLIAILGATNGAAAYQKWLDFNDAIKGNGANAITGLNKVASSHTDTSNDGDGNLLAIYDVSDGIHGNNTLRNINAASWKSAL